MPFKSFSRKDKLSHDNQLRPGSQEPGSFIFLVGEFPRLRMKDIKAKIVLIVLLAILFFACNGYIADKQREAFKTGVLVGCLEGIKFYKSDLECTNGAIAVAVVMSNSIAFCPFYK